MGSRPLQPCQAPPPLLLLLLLLRTMWAIVLELLTGLLWVLYHIVEALVKKLIPEKSRYKDVSGQIVLVTGGGSGIGRLMCQKFARLGATVVTWDINSAGNQDTVDMILQEGLRAVCYTVDMSNKEEIYAAAIKTKEEVGPVTILINNAGIVSGSSILDSPDGRITKTFEVNVFAHFWTIKAFLPDMLEHRQGHVVNIASLAGHSGTPKLVDYCASKFAAVGIDEALRVELFAQGHSDYIKTTVVCPYYISTGMFAGVVSKVVPILEPEYVADRAVAATLTNQEVLLLPWWSMFLISLKALLPSPAFIKLSNAFGLNTSMDEFAGRGKV